MHERPQTRIFEKSRCALGSGDFVKIALECGSDRQSASKLLQNASVRGNKMSVVVPSLVAEAKLKTHFVR